MVNIGLSDESVRQMKYEGPSGFDTGTNPREEYEIDIKITRNQVEYGFPDRNFIKRIIRVMESYNNEPDIFEQYFKRMQAVYRRRFAVWYFKPKKRRFLFGNVPLVRGLEVYPSGEVRARGPRLRPSLTTRNAMYAVRQISGQWANFGTSFPYAKLLHFGGFKGSMRFRFPVRSTQLKWRDDFNNPHEANFTFDAGFYMPPRPFYQALRPDELRYVMSGTEERYADDITWAVTGIRRKTFGSQIVNYGLGNSVQEIGLGGSGPNIGLS